MYAVILSGGKQYKVRPGEIVKLEKIENGIGDIVVFDKVLMVVEGEKIDLGTPYLDGKTVKGQIIEQGRHRKIRIMKFRRRKHSMKQMGHRQYYTAVQITEIAGKKADIKPAKPAKSSAKAAESTAKAAVEKAAPKKAEAKPAEKKAAPKKEAAKKPAAKKPAAKKDDKK